MSRLQADALLLLIAVIWGTAFVAQKMAADILPPCSFVALRFFLSALVILPFALREKRKSAATHPLNRRDVLILSLVFTFSLLMQQAGMVYTTVTHASFLTGLYVLGVPLIGAALYKMAVPLRIYGAAALSCLGVFFLSGGMAEAFSFNKGDVLMLICAAGFALHVILLGRMMMAAPRAFSICFAQYLLVAVIAGGLALIFENPLSLDIGAVLGPVLYLGIVSGGFAYTMQAVAQRHTPPADAAIILGGEALFGALAGIWLLGEIMTFWMWVGGAFILAAMLAVEAVPAIRAARATSRTA